MAAEKALRAREPSPNSPWRELPFRSSRVWSRRRVSRSNNLGAFRNLVVDYEQEVPALSEKRSSGQVVEVSGLSEGTRDQLFMALRIAAIELQLESTKALPFVADDLFINFDDEHSVAGLEALRDLSKRRQVIFLTHHSHLFNECSEAESTRSCCNVRQASLARSLRDVRGLDALTMPGLGATDA